MPQQVDAHEIIDQDWNTIRGRVLGLIESWNVGERHERAMKSTFKSLSYDLQDKSKQKVDLIISSILEDN